MTCFAGCFQCESALASFRLVLFIHVLQNKTCQYKCTVFLGWISQQTLFVKALKETLNNWEDHFCDFSTHLWPPEERTLHPSHALNCSMYAEHVGSAIIYCVYCV